MRSDLILLGGGGHCKACIDVIEQSGKFNIIGVFDNIAPVGSQIAKYEVIGTDNDLPIFIRTIKNYFVTVGQIKSVEKRIELFKMVKNAGGKLPVIKSPLAYVAKSTVIGEGTIIMHRALVNVNTRIGVNCIINSMALIEHDSEVGDHCHVATGAIINGGVQLGDNSFVGSGAITVQGLIIPKNTFIKAGSLFYI